MSALTATRNHLADLDNDPTTAHMIDGWIVDHGLPPMAATTEAVVSAAQDRNTSDAIYRALLTEHSRSNPLATSLLISAMYPMLRRLASRCRGRFDSPADAEAGCIEAFITVVTNCPERSERLASHLAMTTLNAVAGRQAPKAPPAHAELNEDTAVELRAPDHEHVLGTTGEVLQVIAWGLDAQAISPAEAALLTRLYAPDPTLPEWDELGGSFQSAVARELGISHTTLRYRASQAVRRLRSAVLAAN